MISYLKLVQIYVYVLRMDDADICAYCAKLNKLIFS